MLMDIPYELRRSFDKIDMPNRKEIYKNIVISSVFCHNWRNVIYKRIKIDIVVHYYCYVKIFNVIVNAIRSDNQNIPDFGSVDCANIFSNSVKKNYFVVVVIHSVHVVRLVGVK